jgi:hypothetical protein
MTKKLLAEPKERIAYMHAIGWILEILDRLRDSIEFVIMLKVLYYLKLFCRRFCDNKYKM